MRILRVHNAYQHRGGEDVVVAAETKLLRSHGKSVETLIISNDTITTQRSILATLELGLSTVWSHSGREAVAQAARDYQPDIVHFDNTFPLISPGAYSSARASGPAVVQTLHNYRTLCPNALFYRDGHVCEDCLGKTIPYPGVIHSCYRGSPAQTGVVAAMLTYHRLRRTWIQDVDRYIALTEFARQKFIEGGLPKDRIAVKPNFVDAASPSLGTRGDHFLFVGRLSPEKGVTTLLQAQDRHGQEVRIAGDGLLSESLHTAARAQPSFKVLGHLSVDQVRAEMLQARALLFPSKWYEGFPITITEAFANSLPVIASRFGAMAEVIEDNVTGLLFAPGDADDLAAKVRWAAAHPDEMRRMGESARREYETKYTPERNYEMLIEIYERAIAHRRNRRTR